MNPDTLKMLADLCRSHPQSAEEILEHAFRLGKVEGAMEELKLAHTSQLLNITEAIYGPH